MPAIKYQAPVASTGRCFTTDDFEHYPARSVWVCCRCGEKNGVDHWLCKCMHARCDVSNPRQELKTLRALAELVVVACERSYDCYDRKIDAAVKAFRQEYPEEK